MTKTTFAKYALPLLGLAVIWFGVQTLRIDSLLTAASHGDVVEVQALLRQGLDVDSSLGGTTSLILASKRGDTRMVRLLLDHGAAINRPSATGWTPLMKAVDGQYPDTVKLLLERGASVRSRTRRWTALSRAQKKVAENPTSAAAKTILELLQRAGAR